MPKKTPEGRIPYEDIDQRTYHRQYYLKNKELIRAKRMMAKETIVTEDVKKWKEDKLKDPWGHYPFHDYSKTTTHVEEPESIEHVPDKSITDIPSSLSISINSKAL
jgi:hypothetical protein